MSNEVLLEIVKTVGIILTALFSLIGVIYSVKASRGAVIAAAKADTLDGKVDGLDGKVDEYHKEVNGKMGLLIETTKQLATAKEKAKQEKE